MLLSEYLDQWLLAFVVPFRAPSTVACYRRAMASLPAALMQTPLNQITGLMLQAAINAKAARYPRAGQLIFAMLHAALGQAMRLGLIHADPMAACVKPKHQAKRPCILDAQQLKAYLLAARKVRSWPLLLLMATCGLRRSEALGLTWRDVDLAAGTISIRQQRLRSDHTYTAAPLKSASSRRVLPLSVDLVEQLRPMRGHPSAWLLDITPEALAKDHRHCMALIGATGVTLHGLRHSMATICASDGMPIKQLQAVLGHAHYQLTADTYAGHVAAASGAAAIAHLAAQVL